MNRTGFARIDEMAKYEMKYMFDWGSGTCVWSTNDAAIDKYDYHVD